MATAIPFLSKINTSSMTAFSFSSSFSPFLPLAFPSPSARRRNRSRGNGNVNGNENAFAVQAKIGEIFMPALSSTMTVGKIVSWIKSEGDVLSKGESVVVVESDKADMDVETFYDGILAVIVVPDGLSAPVGAPIGILAETKDEIAEAKARASGSAPPPAAPEVVAPSPPPVTATPASAISQSAPAPSPTPEGPRKTVAMPYAKKLAKQHKLDINNLAGTGPYGRITAVDVEAAVGLTPSEQSKGPAVAAAPVATRAAASPPKSAVTPLPPPLPGSTVVPFTTMQSAVSTNMVNSLSVPSFRVGYPVITDALYGKVKPKGVTMTALLAKAAAMALVEHPVVNASCKDGKSLTYNSNINIAVAVAINGGLITPVLQDADKLDLYLLSQKWKELGKKARAKLLQPQEYDSGTFTLSNLGMFGVDRFDAILPPGQGAIMAVGASKPTVVADADGFFSMKSKMLANVTADHRIIYGADLAAFFQTFANIVEDPESLTL